MTPPTRTPRVPQRRVRVLLDTGIVYAYYDRSDSWHERARTLVSGEQGGLVLPASVVPEVDHLLGQRLGAKSRQAFYAGMIEGYYLVADVPREVHPRIAELNAGFDDLGLGFVEATIAALAESLGLTRVATTDRRHFGPIAAALSLQSVRGEATSAGFRRAASRFPALRPGFLST